MGLGKKIGFGLLVSLLLAQIFQPTKNEGAYNLKTFFTETEADEEVQALIFNACVDCHSNQSKYPWYNKITPVNIWIKGHIDEGKKYMNLSEWSMYNKNQKAHILQEFYEEIVHRKMPLKTYMLKHPEANLSKSDNDILVKWAKKAKINFE